MKVSSIIIERTVQDISCVITLDNGKDIIMCGEVVDGNVKREVRPTFYQQAEFDALDERTQDKITGLAYSNFKINLL